MIELRQCIDNLTSEDEANRIYAAEDIGYANQAAGVGPLLARLPKERSRAVRETIFGALLQIDDDSVIEGALALLDSEDSFLRNQAVEVLRARGHRTIPFLNRAFRDENNDRRKFLLDIVARLSGAGTSEIYDTALLSSDLNVVITAVESLGNTRQTQYRGKIEVLLSPDIHPMLLCACIEALAQIGDETSVDATRARLGSGPGMAGYLRPSYLRLLGAKGRLEDVSEIVEIIRLYGLNESALNALTSLRNRHSNFSLPVALSQPLCDIVRGDKSSLLAYQAIRLLGALLDEPKVFEFVEQCLKDPEKSVRIGAVQTMRESGSQEAISALCRNMSTETDAEVLQAWGGKSTE